MSVECGGGVFWCMGRVLSLGEDCPGTGGALTIVGSSKWCYILLHICRSNLPAMCAFHCCPCYIPCAGTTLLVSSCRVNTMAGV